MGLGYQALLADLGIKADLRVWTDSSAAIGIAGRQGLGKLRHLDTHTLWLQQAVRSKRLQLKKVAGTSNPADIFTKHSLTREKLMELVQLFDCHFTAGRAASAPTLRKGASSKTTMASYEEGVHNVVEEEKEVANESGDVPPCMPHTHLTREELDRDYPSLTAPLEVDSPDDQQPEPLLEAGLREAHQIALAMQTYGRTRKDFSAKVVTTRCATTA